MINDLTPSIPFNRLKTDEQKIKITLTVFTGIMLILTANLIWLNVQFAKKMPAAAQISLHQTTPVPTQGTQLPVVADITVTPTPVVVKPIVISDSGKDFFVPLGSGTTQADDWEDIPGAVASVDLGQYKSVKQIVFEASVTVPAANQIVYVRLYNKTDMHPVWYSDVSMNTSSSYLVSQPLTIDNGSKLYQVQMKTQLKSLASLTQSRIHIQLQ